MVTKGNLAIRLSSLKEFLDSKNTEAQFQYQIFYLIYLFLINLKI